MRLKVMQINVWHGRITRPLLDLVKDEAPDVIFTQEIYSYPVAIADPSHWSHLDLANRITATAGLEHVFFSPSFTYPLFGQTLSYGNAIFSKYSLLHPTTHYTGGPGPIHLDSPVEANHNAARNFQHAVIQIEGIEINLINHHGHWANNPHGDDVSADRLQKVADFANTLGGPVILAGDLNLGPDSPAIMQFLASTNLTDVTSQAGATTLSAAHYVTHPIICDYIMINAEFKLGGAKIVDKIVSDHRALIANIEL